MNKFVQWLLNISAGIVFFFFFLFLFFPAESIIRHFLSGVESQTGGAYRIVVGEIKPHILFRSVFTDFKVYQRAEDNDNLLVNLPEVKVGIGYFPLLAGHVKASFSAKGKKGEMEGEVAFSSSEFRLAAEISGMQFADFPSINSLTRLPLEGDFKGSVDLLIVPGQVAKSGGSVDVKIANFKIPAGPVSPYPGFDLDLPETVLADSKGGQLKFKIEKGRLDLETFFLPGADVAVNLKGRIQLNSRFPLSRLSLDGSFRLSDKIKEAIPLLVVIDKQRGEDGSYPLTLSGRFSKPQIRIGSFDVL